MPTGMAWNLLWVSLMREPALFLLPMGLLWRTSDAAITLPRSVNGSRLHSGGSRLHSRWFLCHPSARAGAPTRCTLALRPHDMSCSGFYVIYVRGLMRLLAVVGLYDLMELAALAHSRSPMAWKTSCSGFYVLCLHGQMRLLVVLGLYGLMENELLQRTGDPRSHAG